MMYANGHDSLFGVIVFYEGTVIKERIELVCNRCSATKTSKEESIKRKLEKGPTIKPTQH